MCLIGGLEMNNIKILNAKPIQENFYGFNAVYHGFAGLSDDAGRVLSDELCELEADRADVLLEVDGNCSFENIPKMY